MDNLNLLDERPFDPDECYPWKGMKRCVLKPNGSLVGYLHSDDSNKWDSGDNVDWGLIESNGYNVMVEIPKFYYKKKLPRSGNFDDGHIWMISDAPRYGFELHPAFMRCRDKLCDDLSGVAVEVDYRYAPAFEGWIDSQGRLRSLPNRPTQVSIAMGNSRDSAKKNGNGWGIFDFNLLFAIQLLFSLEYGTYNSQSVMYGFSNSNNNSKRSTGDTLKLGNHSGNGDGDSDNWYGINDGKSSMSYRGIENLYGNIEKWIDGLYCDGNRNILIGNKGFNSTGNGYKDCGKGGNIGISGNINNIQDNNEAGFIIKNNSGAYDKGFYDYGQLYNSKLPYYGGHWKSALETGIFRLVVNNTNTNYSTSIGCSLSF